MDAEFDDMAGADSRPTASGELAGGIGDLSQGVQSTKPKGPEPKGKGKKGKEKEKKPKAKKEPRAKRAKTSGQKLDMADAGRKVAAIASPIVLGGAGAFFAHSGLPGDVAALGIIGGAGLIGGGLLSLVIWPSY